MKSEKIVRVTGTPDWKSIPEYAIDILESPTEAKVKAWAQICYDEKALYLHLRAQESAIRAEMNNPMGQTCDDSCLEFFFRPDPTEMRYFNIEFNMNCCPYIGFGPDIENLVRLHPLRHDFAPKANYTADGWEISYQVPFSFIRTFFPNFSPKPGDTIRANFYKCGDRTEIKHYLAWETPAKRAHGFHCPECFGELVFEV